MKLVHKKIQLDVDEEVYDIVYSKCTQQHFECISGELFKCSDVIDLLIIDPISEQLEII